ncbi:MAG: hypothetical protein ABIE25_06310 [Thermoplasmatota archaeon]
MGIVRFPNPVSDIRMFWETYRVLYGDLHNKTDFGHDDISRTMIEHRLVTSRGAAGQEAAKRSYDEDRTRDPLYNQAKMYSELYRLLGWMHPGKDRTHFVMTHLGDYVAGENTWQTAVELVKQCVLSIVIPNPQVESRSENRIRPFPFGLRLIEGSDGVILRDELIITALCVPDDRAPGALKGAIGLIKSLRGDYKNLRKELSMKAGDLQENTLQNYTRFPLGILKSSNWALPDVDSSLYGKKLTCYRITGHGVAQVANLQKMKDIRDEDLNKFPEDARKSFGVLSHYSFLERAGYPLGEAAALIHTIEDDCREILGKFKIEHRNLILFSPYQQLSRDETAEMERFFRSKYIPLL